MMHKLFVVSDHHGCDTPFRGEGMIAIDAGVSRSGKVNMPVPEDELLPE